MSFVITGAAGNLGRSAAERLLERVDPGEVVLVTRRPEELADLAARGATVRFGDFDAPDSLVEAFAGGERMLLISTDAIGRRVKQHATAIDAARTAGVSHVSYTSVPNPQEANPALVVPDHAATEQDLRESGLAFTFLRNELYSEYQVPEATQAQSSGLLHHNRGDGRTAYVSREDCAAAAAAVLAGGPEHSGTAYDITGPELLDAAALAELYASLGSNPVEAVALDDDALHAALLGGGLPEEVAGLLVSFGAAVRDGYLDQLTSAVRDLTGEAPRSLATVLQQSITEGHEAR